MWRRRRPGVPTRDGRMYLTKVELVIAGIGGIRSDLATLAYTLGSGQMRAQDGPQAADLTAGLLLATWREQGLLPADGWPRTPEEFEEAAALMVAAGSLAVDDRGRGYLQLAVDEHGPYLNLPG